MSKSKTQVSPKDRCRHFLLALSIGFERGEELLKKDPSLLCAKDGLGETPLHYLAVENDLERVKWLFAKGADVNTQNKFGDTPLLDAASLGYVQMASFLLANGADIRLRNQNGETVISKIAANGPSKPKTEAMLRLLLDHAAGIEINELFSDLDVSHARMKHSGDILQLLNDQGLRPDPFESEE